MKTDLNIPDMIGSTILASDGAYHIKEKTFIEDRTGYFLEDWIETIQHLISRSTEDRKTDLSWLHNLVTRFLECKKPRGIYDRNMWACSTLGYILIAWYIRIHKAKSYDPERPIKNRKKALKQWRSFILQIQDLIINESADHKLFPDQKWDNPYLPDAINGDFE